MSQPFGVLPNGVGANSPQAPNVSEVASEEVWNKE
jgi:hypothetical protein